MLRDRTVAFSSQTSLNFQLTEGFISGTFKLRRHARLQRLGQRLKHKIVGHTVDPYTFLHEGVLALMLQDRKLSTSVIIAPGQNTLSQA